MQRISNRIYAKGFCCVGTNLEPFLFGNSNNLQCRNGSFVFTFQKPFGSWFKWVKIIHTSPLSIDNLKSQMTHWNGRSVSLWNANKVNIKRESTFHSHTFSFSFSFLLLFFSPICVQILYVLYVNFEYFLFYQLLWRFNQYRLNILVQLFIDVNQSTNSHLITIYGNNILKCFVHKKCAEHFISDLNRRFSNRTVFYLRFS